MSNQEQLDVLSYSKLEAAKPENIQRLAAFCKVQYGEPIIGHPVPLKILHLCINKRN